MHRTPPATPRGTMLRTATARSHVLYQPLTLRAGSEGHLGYQTTDHLPINRGFDSHLGYLEAAEQYYYGLVGTWADGFNGTHAGCHLSQPNATPPASAACRYDMWEDEAPASAQTINSLYYST